MNGDVTSRETMIEVQGDRVLTHWHEADSEEGGDCVLTFVHVVDTDAHQLRLVNRDDKSREPDWPVGQRLFDAIKPASPNKFNAKWEVRAKI